MTILTQVQQVEIKRCISMQANISVGAKHDRSQYEMITHNLYAVMLRPLPKPDAPKLNIPAATQSRSLKATSSGDRMTYGIEALNLYFQKRSDV